MKEREHIMMSPQSKLLALATLKQQAQQKQYELQSLALAIEELEKEQAPCAPKPE
jgi:hypothetical protein